MSDDDTRDTTSQESRWLLIEEHYRSGKPLTGRVIEATRRSFIVEVRGIRGIVEHPAYLFCLLDSDAEQQLSEEESLERQFAYMKGQELQFKVIEANREHNHLILTQHLHTDDERDVMRQRRERLFQELRPGEIRRGVVKFLTRLTVCVDLEGVEGWIHRSHLSEHSIRDPGEIVQIGQEIEVMVLENNQRCVELSLVHAQLRDEQLRTLLPGRLLTGHICSLSSEGVYVDLGGPLGLIPADQVTRNYITHPADLFHRSQEVVVRIEAIDSSKRALLSLIEVH